MSKIRYSPRSSSDLHSIFDYLKARSPRGADNVLRAIYASIQFVAEFPDASKQTIEPEVRVKIVVRYGLKIFYRVVEEGAVEIVHIRHAAREPEAKFERIE